MRDTNQYWKDIFLAIIIFVVHMFCIDGKKEAIFCKLSKANYLKQNLFVFIFNKKF